MLKTLAMCTLALQVAGCASLLTVGQSEFSCPASTQDGVRCVGVLDVLAASEGQDHVDGKILGSYLAGKAGLAVTEGTAKPASAPATAREASPAPELPQVLRRPPEVLRIALNARVNADGDLLSKRYVLTELRDAEWTLGGRAPAGDAAAANRVAHPLQGAAR